MQVRRRGLTPPCSVTLVRRRSWSDMKRVVGTLEWVMNPGRVVHLWRVYRVWTWTQGSGGVSVKGWLGGQMTQIECCCQRSLEVHRKRGKRKLKQGCTLLSYLYVPIVLF
ncbi:unnamed protein product [Hapterophycus canaliculatus]